MISALYPSGSISLAHRCCVRLRDGIAGVRLRAAACKPQGSVIHRRIVSSTAIWITTHPHQPRPITSSRNIPSSTARIIKVRAYVVREAVLRVDIAQCRSGAPSSAAAIARVTNTVSGYSSDVRWKTYSPDPALFAPKLLPTTPTKVHDWPALFVHLAVAVLPTCRQVMDRLDTDGAAVATHAKTRAAIGSIMVLIYLVLSAE